MPFRRSIFDRTTLIAFLLIFWLNRFKLYAFPLSLYGNQVSQQRLWIADHFSSQIYLIVCNSAHSHSIKIILQFFYNSCIYITIFQNYKGNQKSLSWLKISARETFLKKLTSSSQSLPIVTNIQTNLSKISNKSFCVSIDTMNCFHRLLRWAIKYYICKIESLFIYWPK